MTPLSSSRATRRRTLTAGLLFSALVASTALVGSLPAQAADTSADRMSANPTVSRTAGSSRYATSALIAHSNFVYSNVDCVYIATGESFADSLSAGPAAARCGGPLLLTKPGALPPEIVTELNLLKPYLPTIYVIGGTGTISASVYTALDEYSDNLSRIAGVDRYETSIKVNDQAWGTNYSAWVATGESFADALAASPAAAHHSSPVVLVPGSATVLPSNIKTFLDVSLNVTEVNVVGGTNTISSAMFAALDATPGVTDIERIAGTDRYATAVELNQDAFSSNSSSKAYFVTGLGFADALSGGAAAAHNNAPLYTVQPTCVPASTLLDLQRVGVTQVTLFGGEPVMNSNVAALGSC